MRAGQFEFGSFCDGVNESSLFSFLETVWLHGQNYTEKHIFQGVSGFLNATAKKPVDLKSILGFTFCYLGKLIGGIPMFRYDDPLDVQYKKIQKFLDDEEAVVALIASALNYERIVQRAIIALGTTPTDSFRKKLKWTSFKGYPKVWKKRANQNIQLKDIIEDWGKLKDAFKLRNALVHGEKGTTGCSYAKDRIETIFKATEAVFEFCNTKGVDLNKPLPHRPEKVKPK